MEKETNLQKIRKAKGWSQSKLGGESGVSARVIQNYEQRRRDINNAPALTVYQLAQALGCGVGDILEMGSENA